MKIFKNIYFGAALILTLALLWPIFAAPYFSHQDDVQTIRLYEMDQCFKDRQIPCRWVPDLGGGYGYPLFNYYGPIPYYVGEIFFAPTNNILFAAKMMFLIPFLGSFIFMYLMARKLWGEMGGSLSAVFYSYVPYHALDMYVRGAMGELWAFMFFPAIGWALLRLRERPKLSNALLLGLFMALLLGSHNLSSMIFLPWVLVAVGLIFYKERKPQFLMSFGGAVLIGIGLISFYLLPMTFEKNMVHLETTIEGYFSYTEHFKGLRRLFFDNNWYYGQDNREVPGGPRDTLSYQVGWIHLIGLFLALYAAKTFWKKQRFLSGVILFSTAAIFLSIFMIHPRSEFVWRLIDPLKYLQFPWRFLIIISFFISLIAGSIFATNLPKKFVTPLWIGLIVLLVVFNFSFFKPEKLLYITQNDILIGPGFDHYKMYAIFDYLPKSAKAPPAAPAPAPYQIIAGDTKVSDFAKGTDWIQFNAATKDHTILRLSQYYFPNWEIILDGKKVDIDYKNDLGLMTLLLGEGNHTVDAKLKDTAIRTIGDALSVITILLFIILTLLANSNTRRGLFNYLKAVNR
jgi:hypothetical protein